jgi:hypothetical protein
MRVSLFVAALFAVLSSGSSVGVADEAHCHLRSENGRLSDLPGASNPADCARHHGIWLHHHAHCRVKNEKGKLVDALGVHDHAQCAAKGGEWLDHTHDGNHK